MQRQKITKKITLILLAILGLNSLNLFSVKAQNYLSLKAKNNHKQCPNDVQTLGDLLVKDIPSYANRVIQKSRKSLQNTQSTSLYVIIATKSEFELLPLNQTQYQSSNNEEIKQIFFITKERHYLSKDQVIETQNYHYLLLTKTTKGWQLIMVLSRFGTSNSQNILSPLQDTTKGIIGQAVNLWLKNCSEINYK